MAFLDKLSGMAKNIGDKAGEALETSKLNSKINSEKNAIDGVYKKIGENYYQQYKAGAALPEEVTAFCLEIDGHNTAIEEAKADIERIKSEAAATAEPAPAPVAPAPKPQVASGITCNACGKANEPGTKFCQECGTKLEFPEKRMCTCGAEIAPGARFCGVCGAKFE